MACCAVPCCAVLCCAVLCCAVLYCAVPCRAVPCHAVLCCAVPCRAVPCRAVPCRAVPCRAVPCPCHTAHQQNEPSYSVRFKVQLNTKPRPLGLRPHLHPLPLMQAPADCAAAPEAAAAGGICGGPGRSAAGAEHAAGAAAHGRAAGRGGGAARQGSGHRLGAGGAPPAGTAVRSGGCRGTSRWELRYEQTGTVQGWPRDGCKGLVEQQQRGLPRKGAQRLEELLTFQGLGFWVRASPSTSRDRGPAGSAPCRPPHPGQPTPRPPPGHTDPTRLYPFGHPPPPPPPAAPALLGHAQPYIHTLLPHPAPWVTPQQARWPRTWQCQTLEPHWQR